MWKTGGTPVALTRDLWQKTFELRYVHRRGGTRARTHGPQRSPNGACAHTALPRRRDDRQVVSSSPSSCMEKSPRPTARVCSAERYLGRRAKSRGSPSPKEPPKAVQRLRVPRGRHGCGPQAQGGAREPGAFPGLRRTKPEMCDSPCYTHHDGHAIRPMPQTAHRPPKLKCPVRGSRLGVVES